MEFMGYLEGFLRWAHIAAGIIWLGMLYFFNFVQLPFMGKLDAGMRRTVLTELSPRALFWFRWSALYTYILGLLLLGLVFYHGRLIFDLSGAAVWGAPQFIMIALLLLGFGVYDRLARTPLARQGYLFAGMGFLLIVGVYLGFQFWAGFSYRASLIHTGFLLGTIMAANVWMHIWPAQRNLIRAVREGSAPDPAWMERSLLRSRHNTFLSFPLLWTMVNVHTISYSGIWFAFPLVILLSWGALAGLYAKAGKVNDEQVKKAV